MALSQNLPVYVDVYHYINAVITMQKNLPRDVKHTVGQTWINKALELPQFIIHANMFKSERSYWLSEFICNFEYCKMIVRLAGDNKWISLKQQANLMSLEAVIGKQITAWKNTAKARSKGLKPKSED